MRFTRFARPSLTAAVLCFVLATVLFACPLFAQTSATGTVVGTVTDPQGAVVPGASVTLKNNGTNETATRNSSDQGGFVFPNVTPGAYTLTVTAKGFRTTTIPNLAVDTNKSSNVPVQLSVGAASETVEVQAGTQTELQTTDAQIGNVINTESVLRLPTLQRNVTELMNLQPGVVPAGNNLQLRASGAIEDQNTVTLDGIDITENVISNRTTVPTPADSVEEFRVGVANPNANYDRASGGQITLVGRHGSNTPHGAVYWYHQNDDLNANTWDNNYSKIKKPEMKDNRFGARFGGPIFKNKTFFFANYEGRRFASATQVTRVVPTDTLKQGILRFRDASGQVVNYNLATAALCGSSGSSACDPRGLGISPSVKALWSLMPSGNISGGDGLNTTGFLANIATPLQDDYGVIRLDHNFSERLKFNSAYTYFRESNTSSGQVAIANTSAPHSVRQAPQRGALASGSLIWTIRPTLLNTFRFGYVRNRDAGLATVPTASASLLNIPGTQTSAGPIAILPGSGVSSFLDAPIDMDTQRGRFQSNDDSDIQFIDDVNWTRGNHNVQIGGQFNILPYTHQRGDKVIGSVTSLVADMDTSSGNGLFLSIPSVNTPRTCGSGVTTNCLVAGDVANWGRFYAATLGLLDNVSILAVRDQNLNPLPFGTNLLNVTRQYAYYFYGQDSWRVTPSLTLTYGLSYGWQSAPTEKLGRQTLMIDATTGQPLSAEAFLSQKQAAAQQGQIFNPTVGFVPVGKAGRPVYNVDYGDLAPRASFAWNPGTNTPLIGRLMGDHKTVVRGGWAVVYDRSNTVQSVEIPMLGIGFDQNINIATPVCNVSGAPGPGCVAGSVSANPGLSDYRVGVDGSIPLPKVGPVSSPVVPPLGQFSETLSFQVDPNTKVGRTQNVDLSVQRELPGNMLLEAAYVGRFGRHLPQAVNLTQSPYMFVDTKSGQTFAQAFDAVAAALRAGQAAPTEPWFENQLPGIASTGTATAFVVARNGGNFINGNVSTIFQNLGVYRRSLGLQPYNNDQAITEFMRTYIGESNYNGLLVTLRNRTTKGLTWGMNYTYSKVLDDELQWQNNAGFYSNSFHPGTDYGPSLFDRRHVFSGYYVYDLPAGHGHALFTNGILDKVFGGWYTSGVVSVLSGVPITVNEGGNVWGGGLIVQTQTAAIPTGPLPSTGLHGSPNNPIVGSGGIGTNGNPSSVSHGTGMNIFADPAAAFGDFRSILLSQDIRSGRGQAMYGLGSWNMDATLGKTTRITERVSARFSFDFFNLFNHPIFSNPGSLALNSNRGGFGVISSEATPPNRTNGARWIEFGARIEF